MTSASALECHDDDDDDGDGDGLRRGSDELGAGPRQGDRTISFGARQGGRVEKERSGLSHAMRRRLQQPVVCHVVRFQTQTRQVGDFSRIFVNLSAEIFIQILVPNSAHR